MTVTDEQIKEFIADEIARQIQPVLADFEKSVCAGLENMVRWLREVRDSHDREAAGHTIQLGLISDRLDEMSLAFADLRRLFDK
jgi:hypothetical protein